MIVPNQYQKGIIRMSVLIPTCGRPDAMVKLWRRKMNFLNHEDTFIGIHQNDWDSYKSLRNEFQKCQYVAINNPHGSVAVAREQLRVMATHCREFLYHVVTDDNAVFTRGSLFNLVKASQVCQHHLGVTVVAGMHGTAQHFDRGRIARGVLELDGTRTYAGVAMMFQCYPAHLYREYQYPADAFGLDDRHMVLWMIDRMMGRHQFRVCMDAPFTKPRYAPGGQGPVEARLEKNGKAIARLATDFPKLVGATGTLPIKWEFLFNLQMGRTATRMPAGAMRKETALTISAKVRVRRSSSS